MKMIEIGHHLPHHGDDFGMAVAEDPTHLARGEVEYLPSLTVVDVRALSPCDALIGEVTAITEDPAALQFVHHPLSVLVDPRPMGRHHA